MDYGILVLWMGLAWFGQILLENASATNEPETSELEKTVATVPRRHQPRNHDYNQVPHGYEELPTDKESLSGLPRKVSVQSTFTFTTEKRCLDFLKRLKGKGLNENPTNPLTCPATFDGILCWRPADPGEELQQVCPDGPMNLNSFAKRECVHGKWKQYQSGGNERLNIHGINQTDFSECFRVAGFVRKHGGQSNSAEMRGPTVSDYGYPTPGFTAYTEQHAPRPDDSHHTTAANKLYDGQNAHIPKPLMIVDMQQCQQFLRDHHLDNIHDGWCRGMSDGRMCWPATPPGVQATQPCHTVDQITIHTLNATRYCGTDGKWNTSKADGSIGSSDPDNGWTDYDACDVLDETLAGVTIATLQKIPLDAHEMDLKQSEPVQPAELEFSVTAVPETTNTATAPPEVLNHGYGTWLIATAPECETSLRKSSRWDEKEAGSCRGGTDGTICWPTTRKNTIASESCPHMFGLDAKKLVTRECGADGKWRKASGSYTECFSQEIKDIMKHDFQVNPVSAAVQFSIPWLVINFVFAFMLFRP